MPTILHKVLNAVFSQRQQTKPPADPLARFRTTDGGLAIKIEACVLKDGSMVIKAPGLPGFAIGLEKPCEEKELKSIISKVFQLKLKSDYNLNKDDYAFELATLSDKSGYVARIMSPPPTPKPANPKP